MERIVKKYYDGKEPRADKVDGSRLEYMVIYCKHLDGSFYEIINYYAIFDDIVNEFNY